jgi:S-adenosylmethionine synthetase
MKPNYFFTSESVTEGHPDKICDQISDAILDAALKEDPYSRVAIETAVTTGLVLVFGEMTTATYVDIQSLIRKTVKAIGYDRGKYGFDADNVGVLVAIDPQSEDISKGISHGDQLGAGDQGIMFGYATDETDEYMPITAVLAHKLARRLTEVRKDKTLAYLRPDGKTQVTVEFDGNGQPLRIDAVVLSTQHAETVSLETLKKDIMTHVIEPILPSHFRDDHTKYYINPTGKFVIGGPQGDSGLTGRKIIVDTYGGAARHGGGAFSGKDPSKVDRSAAYAARWVAKNIVAAGLAKRCEIQLSYAIGIIEPTSIYLDTFGTSTISEAAILKALQEVFDLRPSAIIKELDLLKPIYQQVAAYGHFGRDDLSLPWEALNKVNALKKAIQAYA